MNSSSANVSTFNLNEEELSVSELNHCIEGMHIEPDNYQNEIGDLYDEYNKDASLEKALKEPQDVQELYDMAEEAYEIGEFSRAKELSETGLARWPFCEHFAYLYTHIYYAEASEKGQIDLFVQEWRKHLEHLVAIAPSSAMYLFSLGKLCYLYGDFNDTIANCKKAIKTSNDRQISCESYFYLAAALVDTKKITEARKNLKQAIKLGCQNPALDHLRRVLDI